MELADGRVIYEKGDGIASIILNRPEKLNVMDSVMMATIYDLFRTVEEDQDVKVVVLKGSGRCFSAGWDLGEIGWHYKLEEVRAGEHAERWGARHAVYWDRRHAEGLRAIATCLKTTIAQVHGYCLGYPWMIVQMCDFIIASDDAEFGHVEQRLGAAGCVWNFPVEIFNGGMRKARELAISGRRFGAQEAERLGLINQMVPKEKLEAEVREFAETVRLLPGDGLMIGKAYWHTVLDTIGVMRAFNHWPGIHAGVYGLKWQEDEYNFLKKKRDSGVKEAFRGRDARFGGKWR